MQGLRPTLAAAAAAPQQQQQQQQQQQRSLKAGVGQEAAAGEGTSCCSNKSSSKENIACCNASSFTCSSNSSSSSSSNNSSSSSSSSRRTGQASAVEEDVSLQCALHAYRFSLRDFDIGGYLGDGAHGSVFLARERRSGFLCVLKCITKAHLIRGGNEALLKKEVELQAHLKHPHICCMYGWFQTTSSVFLLMEYCHEGDLFSLLDKTQGGFSEQQVARMAFQIGWAIRTCHDKRIAHLDIKPENVLVTEKFDLKLADFGLSAHIGGAHRKRGVSINRGTCDYFSPEQCLARMKSLAGERHRQVQQQQQQLQQQQQQTQQVQHQLQQQLQQLEKQQQQLAEALKNVDSGIGSTFDEKTDIWMLGVLAFELFFKVPPFGSQCMVHEEEVMRNITSKDWKEGLIAQAQQNRALKQKLDSMSPAFQSA